MSVHTGPLSNAQIVSSPCNCDLQIPPSLEAVLTPELQLAVAKIRLKYAHDIAQLQAAALAEVSKLVQDHR
jgi:hypothetical protein